jgi:hypothetical protein
LACGWRKAPTPFAIASIPVRALLPDAKALSTRKKVRASVPGGTGFGTDARGQPEIAHVASPVRIVAAISTMNA